MRAVNAVVKTEGHKLNEWKFYEPREAWKAFFMNFKVSRDFQNAKFFIHNLKKKSIECQKSKCNWGSGKAFFKSFFDRAFHFQYVASHPRQQNRVKFYPHTNVDSQKILSRKKISQRNFFDLPARCFFFHLIRSLHHRPSTTYLYVIFIIQ